MNINFEEGTALRKAVYTIAKISAETNNLGFIDHSFGFAKGLSDIDLGIYNQVSIDNFFKNKEVTLNYKQGYYDSATKLFQIEKAEV